MTRIPFILLSNSDGSPLTGATSSVTISKDGSAFASATNTPSEIGNGYYYVDLTTAETTVNNNVIVRATATGAQPTAVVWEPEVTMPNIQTELTTYGAAKASDIPDISGLATATDVTTAQAAIIGAMPTTAGLATASDVTTAQAAIIAAMPDVSGLSTFDAGTDAVNLSINSVNAVQAGLSTFDPSTDSVTIDATQAATFGTSTAQTSILALLETLYSGLYHWEVNNNTLTIYDADGLAISAYTLTKDAIGNIIAVTPED